ncbi:outer membrane beta-barrel protein [Flammeovirgaceae bacterium SG7u.111]|nr:outer membrane beta-barrel protein [Flammeovirgaceae bacterium SG7u.132]WPO33087.1 outer membrane beta-barrel protein [Flammeovirgaceae bacterium SG7u.111]
MKKIILLLFVLGSFQIANAQLIKFGVRGGVNSASLTSDDLIVTSDDEFEQLKLKAGDAQLGFHVGAMARINIPVLPLYVQPELLITSVGGEYTVEDLKNGAAPEKAQVKFTRLDIPAMVGFKLGPVALQAGPIATIVISDKNDLEDKFTNFEQSFNGATFGYQAGVGLNLGKIVLDLKYEGNLSKLGDSVKILGQERSFDTRQNQVILSAGVFF